MPPIHIGDSWTFDLVGRPFPTDSTTAGQSFAFQGDTGVSVPGENFHAMLTGRIRWQRPAADTPITLRLEMDLDGYDATTGELLPGGDDPSGLGFDSNLYYRLERDIAASEGPAQMEEVINIQSVMAVPANCAFKMRMLEHRLFETDAGYGSELLEMRMVLTVVNPRA